MLLTSKCDFEQLITLVKTRQFFQLMTGLCVIGQVSSFLGMTFVYTTHGLLVTQSLPFTFIYFATNFMYDVLTFVEGLCKFYKLTR